MEHKISLDHLSLERVKEIIDKKMTLSLSEEAEKAIVKCRKYLDSKMEDIGRPVYGVTTGFGSLCNVTIPEDQLSLAIGKEGQNARLAAKLTNYKIDIKPVSEV